MSAPTTTTSTTTTSTATTSTATTSTATTSTAVTREVPAPGGDARGVGDVVYVVLDPGVPAYGRKGCSVHVQEVLRQLARRARAVGGRVHLVAVRVGGPVPTGLEDVVVHELGRPAADGPAAAERALIALDRSAADLVTALVAAETGDGDEPSARPLVYQRYGLWSAAVLEGARAAGARTVLEVNAPLVQEQARHRVLVDDGAAVTMTQRALRAADLAYAVSGAVATWAQELSGVPVHVLPNGVDAARFRPATGSGGEPPVVGFVGTFRPWHGVELLVASAAELVATGDPVRLLLVGDGPTRPAVLAAARAAGVEVEAPGAVDPAAVPALLARCDVAAAPYPAGPAYFSPLKVVEYLAAGLPVVAAGVADLPRLLHTDEALVVPPGDGAALTAALRRLVRDPVLRASLAVAGRAAAGERFGWDGVVRHVLHHVGPGGVAAARPVAGGVAAGAPAPHPTAVPA